MNNVLFAQGVATTEPIACIYRKYARRFSTSVKAGGIFHLQINKVLTRYDGVHARSAAVDVRISRIGEMFR